MSEFERKIRPIADDLIKHCQSQLGFKEPPELFFIHDTVNAQKTLGKTAHYDPQAKHVAVYFAGRHPKDVLRSIAHELVHHLQNTRGDLNSNLPTGPGYAQKDSHLRNMEAEAYLLGNMLFRDWEDGIKAKILQEKKEITNMNKETIRNLVKERIIAILQEQEKQIAENGEEPLEEILEDEYEGEVSGEELEEGVLSKAKMAAGAGLSSIGQRVKQRAKSVARAATGKATGGSAEEEPHRAAAVTNKVLKSVQGKAEEAVNDMMFALKALKVGGDKIDWMNANAMSLAQQFSKGMGELVQQAAKSTPVRENAEELEEGCPPPEELEESEKAEYTDKGTRKVPQAPPVEKTRKVEPIPPVKEEEELEEQSKTDRPDRVAGRDAGGRRLDEEEIEEGLGTAIGQKALQGTLGALAGTAGAVGGAVKGGLKGGAKGALKGAAKGAIKGAKTGYDIGGDVTEEVEEDSSLLEDEAADLNEEESNLYEAKWTRLNKKLMLWSTK